MSTADITLFVAQLVGAWSVGFCGGWIITIFNRAIDQVS